MDIFKKKPKKRFTLIKMDLGSLRDWHNYQEWIQKCEKDGLKLSKTPLSMQKAF